MLAWTDAIIKYSSDHIVIDHEQIQHKKYQKSIFTNKKFDVDAYRSPTKLTYFTVICICSHNLPEN